MRNRKHLLLFILLLSCLLWGVLTALQSLPKWMGASGTVLQKRIAVSNSSFVYVLKPAQWLDFKLPAGTDSIRLISNASISALLPTEPSDSWQYALDYQLVDKNGKLLAERTYHKRAGLNKIEDSESEQFTPIFYLSDAFVPLDGQNILLDLFNLPDADQLRIKLASADPVVTDVAVRAYYQENIPERKSSLMWKRMSEKRKEILASGNIYSFDLLTDQERRSLLLKLQRPLSPIGIEGYDYQSRVLYSMQAYEGQKVYEPIALQGVLVNEHYRGVIPIPENGGSIRLQFDQAYADQVTQVLKPITIRWFGREVTERSKHEIIWRGETVQFEQSFDGGLLEISSDSNIVVRAFLGKADDQLEITPEALYLRGYQIGEGASLTYPVAHADMKSTPFRVDFRYIVSSPEQHVNAAATIEYMLIDEHGHIIKQDSIHLQAEASFYDRIVGDMADNILSDPITRYFSLPKNVNQIKFKADNLALVFAYNRPIDLIHETKVPENSYTSDLDEWSQPAWFPVRPVDYERLILKNQSILLTIQPRPSGDKFDLLAGRYLWEDYHPQGNWRARYLFSPIDNIESIREEAFLSVYRPITPGRTETFYFQAPFGVTSITPNLAYFRHDTVPFDISIFIDNELFFQRRVDGQRGEIQLPTLSAGQHNVKVVTGAPAKVMLSPTKPTVGSFFKRLVNRFDQNKLNFVYDRESLEEEILSVRLYVPYGTKNRTKVRVQIETIDFMPLTPMSSWSFDARRFDVRPGVTAIPVMGANADQVDHGYPFFITLGEGLPVGRYRIHFFLETAIEGYLSLTKVTPGVFQKRDIFHETEALNVQATK